MTNQKREERRYYNAPAHIRFLELVEKSGLETARAIAALTGTSESRISRYFAGTREPDHLFLALLQERIKENQASGGTRYPSGSEKLLMPDDPEVRSAADQLRELHANDPDAFKAAAGVIATFYSKKKAPSSKVKRAAKSLVETAAARVRAASQERGRKSPADESSAEK